MFDIQKNVGCLALTLIEDAEKSACWLQDMYDGQSKFEI